MGGSAGRSTSNRWVPRPGKQRPSSPQVRVRRTAWLPGNLPFGGRQKARKSGPKSTLTLISTKKVSLINLPSSFDDMLNPSNTGGLSAFRRAGARAREKSWTRLLFIGQRIIFTTSDSGYFALSFRNLPAALNAQIWSSHALADDPLFLGTSKHLSTYFFERLTAQFQSRGFQCH